MIVSREGVVTGSVSHPPMVYIIYENIFPLPPHHSQGIIFVYDITSKRTFDNIPRWLTDVERVGVRVYSAPKEESKTFNFGNF